MRVTQTACSEVSASSRKTRTTPLRAYSSRILRRGVRGPVVVTQDVIDPSTQVVVEVLPEYVGFVADDEVS